MLFNFLVSCRALRETSLWLMRLTSQNIFTAKWLPFTQLQATAKSTLRILGVTIVTPIRNDHGRFRSPHANVLGRLAPNCLPT